MTIVQTNRTFFSSSQQTLLIWLSLNSNTTLSSSQVVSGTSYGSFSFCRHYLNVACHKEGLLSNFINWVGLEL